MCGSYNTKPSERGGFVTKIGCQKRIRTFNLGLQKPLRYQLRHLAIEIKVVPTKARGSLSSEAFCALASSKYLTDDPRLVGCEGLEPSPNSFKGCRATDYTSVQQKIGPTPWNRTTYARLFGAALYQ